MPVTRILDFDTWRPGYAGASVTVYRAGTTTPATLYANEGLAVTLGNPQTLLTRESDGIQYGKWAQPVYVNEAVELQINSTDNSAVIRPALTSLAGLDAGTATVRRTGGTQDVALSDVLARFIFAEDFGALEDGGGGSAATNVTTITTAIAAAAAQGGGEVILPPGTYNFTQLSLPKGVRLRGAGRLATVLVSTTANKLITITGDGAGLASLTIDGSSRVAGSVGVFAANKNEIVLDDVLLDSLDVGLRMNGGNRPTIRELYIDNCATGALLQGDSTDSGAELRDFEWSGGRVTNCTTFGVKVAWVDKVAENVRFLDVGFDTNTGTAIQVTGGHLLVADGCWWSGNTVDLKIEDGSPENDDNTVYSVRVFNCRIDGGEINLEDSLEDVIFDQCILDTVEITLTAPGQAVLARDCREVGSVVIGGDATKWIRWRSTEHGATVGLTTDATATKAWSLALDPGQRVYLEAKAIGVQRNAANTSGEYHVAVSAERPDSTLAYDAQTVNFTVGQIITGGTSGATALITGDTDGGVTGTLTVREIDGVFQDNELITDPLGGSATVNGTLTHQNCALLGTNTSLRADREDTAGWAAVFAANGPEIEFQVTGAVGATVQWIVTVDVLASIP